MYGILEVADVNDPHQNAHHSNSFGQERAKFIQLPLQGSGLICCLRHGMPVANKDLSTCPSIASHLVTTARVWLLQAVCDS